MKKDNDERGVILITGGSGLIGAALARVLAGDYRVVALDRDRPKDSNPAIDWQQFDLAEPGSLEAAVEAVRRRYGERFASVVHLAAYYDFSGEPSPLYEQLTVRGTESLLRLLQRFDVEQFVFSSTILVLQPSQEGELLREGSPYEAHWDYPESKIRAESVIKEQRGDTPSVILRIAGVYDEDGHSPPITQQISRIHQKKIESYLFPGDASRGQSFVHLDDVVEALRRVVERRRTLGDEEVFLIGEPDVMSYEELQEEIGKQLHGEEWPAVRIPKAVAKAGAWVKEKLGGDDESFIKPWMIDLADAHYPVSIDHARQRLGWAPSHSLRDTLPEMLRRLQADPERWYRENDIEPPKAGR